MHMPWNTMLNIARGISISGEDKIILRVAVSFGWPAVSPACKSIRARHWISGAALAPPPHFC